MIDVTTIVKTREGIKFSFVGNFFSSLLQIVVDRARLLSSTESPRHFSDTHATLRDPLASATFYDDIFLRVAGNDPIFVEG